MIKKFGISVLAIVLLLSFAVMARGEASSKDASASADGPASAEKYRGEFTALAGNQSMGKLDYALSDHFQIQAFSQDATTNFGLRFQPADWFGIKAGATYESDVKETVPYGGIDFNTPFGTNNLRLTGYYDYNYYGKDWSRYELALRIQMYESLFMDAGVRGDSGNNAPTYSYNNDREALLFLRGVFDWTSPKGKWSLSLDPLLYVNGTFLHDYTIKYNISKNTSIMANVNTLYEPSQFNYRAGVQIRF